MTGSEKQWCILRTSGRTTINLADTLSKDGFDAWTPVETRTISVPRVNAKREVRLPLMPSYVFAGAHHLTDLLQLAAMPVRPRRGAGRMDAAHVAFHVLHCFGGIPIIDDRHLGSLRRLEAKRTPVKRAAYAFPKNAAVRAPDGPFGGMSGVVVRSTDKATVIDFGYGFPTEIPTSLLVLDNVKDGASAPIRAA